MRHDNKFRLFGFGIDFSGIKDKELKTMAQNRKNAV
jgi:hypothetical protein